MKITIYFLSAFLIISCVEPPPGDPRDMRSDHHKEAQEALNDLKKKEETPDLTKKKGESELRKSIGPEIFLDDFIGSVFDMGEKHHLNEDCEMVFECDCCGSQIAFLDNGIFFDHAICVSDEDLYTGKYKLESNNITLTYSRIHASKNFKGEENPELTTDTMQERIMINFTSVLCSSDLILQGNIDDASLYLVNNNRDNTNFLKENKELIDLIWSGDEGVNMD